MPTLYITVWEDAQAVPLGAPIQAMAVTIGAASADSAAVVGDNKRPRRVRLFADSDCFVSYGESPTAVNDGSEGFPMGAENPEYFDVRAGSLIAVLERL